MDSPAPLPGNEAQPFGPMRPTGPIRRPPPLGECYAACRFLYVRGATVVGHIPRVMVAKAAIASEHIRHAFLDRTKLAVPDHTAVAYRHDRAPGRVPIGL